MGKQLLPWQDLITLRERIERLLLATGAHRHIYETTNLRPDCNFDCQDCRTHANLGQLLDLATAAVEMLRFYRTRMHLPMEDEDGNQSVFHRAYGIHYDAMRQTDTVLQAAKKAGLATGQVPTWE